jgi:hypothetical protein
MLQQIRAEADPEMSERINRATELKAATDAL